MPPKNKPNQVKAEPKGKQRAAGEKTVASDEGANWLKEAWRRAGFNPFNGSTIAAKAAALGLRASAIMTAPRPAPEPGKLPSSSSSSSFTSLSQPTPRTTAMSASALKTKASAPLAVSSVTAAASLLSPNSAIDAALRAHHKRMLFDSKTLMLQDNVTLRRSRYRMSLLMEREIKRDQSHCDLFMQIFMVALWLSYDR
jgi:hypothetical protein